jgi:hypothetical protein
MLTIRNEFDIGDEAYLETDYDQRKRIVTGILINPESVIMYRLVCGNADSWHYAFEITAEKTF